MSGRLGITLLFWFLFGLLRIIGTVTFGSKSLEKNGVPKG